MKHQSPVLGVDIGGTKVAAGLIHSGGNVVFKTRHSMKSTGTEQEAMAAVHLAIRDCMQAAADPVTRIGVVSPGPLDIPSGVVLNPPNLPCWVNFALADEIRREYELETYVDNDANAAGLAEALWGAGAGYKSVFYATVGTGIGTAIVLDRKLYDGRSGMAAEGGHITVDYCGEVTCGCGKPGCVEGIAAGPGIARRAQKRVAAGEPTEMTKLAGGDIAAISTHTVVEAWRADDKVATEVMTETMDVLTVWFGNVIDLLEPEVIVVGGGMGSVISEWFGYIQDCLPQWSINPRCQQIPFSPAKFGVDAGIVGAAALCYAKHTEVSVGSTT